MTHERLLQRIRDRTGLESTTTAAAATAATLQTLGEKLTMNEVSVLVTALPGDLARVVAEADDGPPLAFGPEEFVERVRERERAAGLGTGADAEHHVRAVFEVLSTSLDPDDWLTLRARLTSEYSPLYDRTEPLHLAG
jgi:uncharacterized protein (DUF2267 family)